MMAAILAHREVAPLLSDEHFAGADLRLSVDGTLIKAWASMKSFQPKPEGSPPDDGGPGEPPAPDTAPETQPAKTRTETNPMPRPTRPSRNAEVDFKGETRSNATHVSATDPEARLYKKSPGTGAMLCFIGHALMENRSGLIVQGDLTQSPFRRMQAFACRATDGHAERRAALDMVHRHSPGSTRRLTPGADKGYDAAVFVADLRKACVTPHVAQKSRYSAIPSRRMHAFACRAVDGRTTRHEGYAQSIQHRKRIDVRRENDPPDRFLILLTFGWAKTIGDMAQTVYRGAERVWSRFILTMAANNLARLPGLLATRHEEHMTQAHAL